MPTTQRSFRVHMAGCFLLFFLLALVGCQPQDAVPSHPDPNESKTYARIALEAFPTTFDATLVASERERELSTLLYDSLYRYSTDFSLRPSLVLEYRPISDTVAEFVIRSDVRFHDGSALTADDVVYTLETIIASPYSLAGYRFISNVEKTDDYAVRVHLYQPYAHLFQLLTCGIVPKAVHSAGVAVFAENPIGSGPYRYASSADGQEFTLSLHEAYWGTPGHIEELDFVIIPQATERLAALERGDVDLVLSGILKDDVARLQEHSSIVVELAPSAGYEYLGFMLGAEPFATQTDATLRQAFAYALNKEALAASMQGFRTNVTLPPQHWAAAAQSDDALQQFVDPPYSIVERFDQDVERAERLKRDAGYGGSISIPLLTTPGRAQLAELVKKQLSAINVQANIVLLEVDTLAAEMTAHNTLLFLHGWAEQFDPDQSTLFVSTEIPPDGANRLGYTNPRIDELYANGQSQLDTWQRLLIYSEAWQKMINEETWFVPLYTPAIMVARSTALTGVEVAPAPIGTLPSLVQATVVR